LSFCIEASEKVKFSRVLDLHHLNANPYPAFHSKEDPDPNSKPWVKQIKDIWLGIEQLIIDAS
jgi:hypothetical protein